MSNCAQIAAEPEYLTIAQLAALLQVSEKSVSRWASDDASMPVLRIGRLVRFPRRRLLRWLAAREQGLGKVRRSRQPLPSSSQIVGAQGTGNAQSLPCAVSCVNSPTKSGKGDVLRQLGQ